MNMVLPPAAAATRPAHSRKRIPNVLDALPLDDVMLSLVMLRSERRLNQAWRKAYTSSPSLAAARTALLQMASAAAVPPVFTQSRSYGGVV
ncbi:hypothetical protein N5J29_00540 [Stenotrophomonas sp. GD03680]|uniref:hypothetical protein n=1 Tax=Stenotrophomonas sp. GD03680 TaxID=2975365 RepID=UPI00244B6480|nr:hypothetical protein [Stenotrophomonas sp. GD03680]MDH2021238.1 hypothetical protein [Stenotrophomonas sp. GD03680]